MIVEVAKRLSRSSSGCQEAAEHRLQGVENLSCGIPGAGQEHCWNTPSALRTGPVLRLQIYSCDMVVLFRLSKQHVQAEAGREGAVGEHGPAACADPEAAAQRPGGQEEQVQAGEQPVLCKQ